MATIDYCGSITVLLQDVFGSLDLDGDVAYVVYGNDVRTSLAGSLSGRWRAFRGHGRAL